MTANAPLPRLMTPHGGLTRLFQRLCAARLIEAGMTSAQLQAVEKIFLNIKSLCADTGGTFDAGCTGRPVPTSRVSSYERGRGKAMAPLLAHMASLLDLGPRCSAPEVVGFANQVLSGDEMVTAPKVGVADRRDPQPFASPCPEESGRGTPDDRCGDRDLRPDGPEVGDADRVEPAALLRREGIEYLGTYTLFHLDGAAWGIRLYVDRIAATAAKHAPNVGLTARHATAALLVDVLLHEWHHFIEEMVGSLLELDLGLPLVAHFQREVYRNTWPDVRNEALANAFALSELPRHLRASAPVIQKAKRLAKEVMDQCPGAYSRYGEFLRVHSRPASGPYGAGVAAWVMGDVLRSAMSIAPADASAAGAPTANTAGFEGLSQLPVGVLARARKAGTWPMHAAVPVRLLEEGGALAGTFWNVMRTA